MEGLSVREIRCEDYHDIYLLNQEFNSERSDFSAEKVKERIQYIIKNTRDIVLVCEYRNEVIGYIHGSPYELIDSDSLINLLYFIVKEQYRNKGVGSKLINSLEKRAKEKGFSGIKLLTHPYRVQAHRFYEGRGNIYTKDQKNYMKMFK